MSDQAIKTYCEGVLSTHENHGGSLESATVARSVLSLLGPDPTEPLADRHPSTMHVLNHFAYGHLPEHLRGVSKASFDLAREMVRVLPDGQELSVGLRKLLEAKDCFVRQAIDSPLNPNASNL